MTKGYICSLVAIFSIILLHCIYVYEFSWTLVRRCLFRTSKKNFVTRTFVYRAFFHHWAWKWKFDETFFRMMKFEFSVAIQLNVRAKRQGFRQTIIPRSIKLFYQRNRVNDIDLPLIFSLCTIKISSFYETRAALYEPKIVVYLLSKSLEED